MTNRLTTYTNTGFIGMNEKKMFNIFNVTMRLNTQPQLDIEKNLNMYFEV